MPCFAILSLHSNRQAPQAPAKQSGRWPPGVLAIWRRRGFGASCLDAAVDSGMAAHPSCQRLVASQRLVSERSPDSFPSPIRPPTPHARATA